MLQRIGEKPEIHASAANRVGVHLAFGCARWPKVLSRVREVIQPTVRVFREPFGIQPETRDHAAQNFGQHRIRSVSACRGQVPRRQLPISHRAEEISGSPEFRADHGSVPFSTASRENAPENVHVRSPLYLGSLLKIKSSQHSRRYLRMNHSRNTTSHQTLARLLSYTILNSLHQPYRKI